MSKSNELAATQSLLSISGAITALTVMLTDSAAATPILIGGPGIGKSDAAWKIGENVLEALGVPEELRIDVKDGGRIGRYHLGNFEVVDFTGVPVPVPDPERPGYGTTRMWPTDLFAAFQAGTGPGVIILEEVPQSSHAHQTWCAGFILERCNELFRLDPEVRIICTGNRVEDRAGAKPLLTHLADRLYFVQVGNSPKDWCEWALANNVPPLAVAFISARPELLNTFDPQLTVNATQRSWTQLFTDIKSPMPTDLYQHLALGKVGAPAEEWVAFRRIADRMPKMRDIRANPDTAPIPEDPEIRYAVAGALAQNATEESLAHDMRYIRRMPREFQMVAMRAAVTRLPALKRTKAYIEWTMAKENQEVFLAGV